MDLACAMPHHQFTVLKKPETGSQERCQSASIDFDSAISRDQKGCRKRSRTRVTSFLKLYSGPPCFCPLTGLGSPESWINGRSREWMEESNWEPFARSSPPSNVARGGVKRAIRGWNAGKIWRGGDGQLSG